MRISDWSSDVCSSDLLRSTVVGGVEGGISNGTPPGNGTASCDGENVMRVGVPKEIKNHEYRVGLTPFAVREFTAAGHEVIVQPGAGAGPGAEDRKSGVSGKGV